MPHPASAKLRSSKTIRSSAIQPGLNAGLRRVILLEVAKCRRNREIALTLDIEVSAVKKHLEHIFDKLGVDNRTAAVAWLRQAHSR